MVSWVTCFLILERCKLFSQIMDDLGGPSHGRRLDQV